MSQHETIWTKWMSRGRAYCRYPSVGDAVKVISDEFEALRILNDAKFTALEARIDFMQREIDSLRVEVASK